MNVGEVGEPFSDFSHDRNYSMDGFTTAVLYPAAILALLEPFEGHFSNEISPRVHSEFTFLFD